MTPNVYRHYNGGHYEKISEARMAASGESVTVYRSLLNPDEVLVVPTNEFNRNFTLVDALTIVDPHIVKG